MKPRWEVVLCLVVLSSFLFRVYLSLFVDGVLWWDEAIYASMIRDLSRRLTLRFEMPYIGAMAYRPVLYPYLAALACIATGGYSEAVVKVLTCALGVLAAIPVCQLARKLSGGKAGLIAVASLLFMPVHVFYGSRLLVNVVEATFLSAGFYFAYQAVCRLSSPYALLSGLAMGLACSTRYTAILSPFIASAWALTTRKTEVLRLAPSFLAGLLAGLAPTLAVSQVVYGSPISCFLVAFNVVQHDVPVSTARFLADTVAGLNPVLFLLAFLGVALTVKQHDRGGLLVLLWFLAYLVVFCFLTHKEARFMVSCSPAVAVLASIPFKRLLSKKMATALFIIALLAPQPVIAYKLSGRRSLGLHVAEAARYVSSRTRPWEGVLSNNYPVVRYYSDRPVVQFWPSPNQTLKALKVYRVAYVVLDLAKPYPTYVHRFLSSGLFRKECTFEVGGVKAVVYRFKGGKS